MDNGNRDQREKDRERARLAADVEAFVRRGGTIKEVPVGVLSQPEPMRPARAPVNAEGFTG